MKRRKLNRILKLYGKAMCDSYAEYLVRESGEVPCAVIPLSRKNRRKHVRITRKYATVLILLACLAAAMTAAVSAALDMQLFHFHFHPGKGQAVLENMNRSGGKYVYRPDYIVKGYHLEAADKIDDSMIIYTYQNASGQTYGVSCDRNRDTVIGVNTEDVDKQICIVNGKVAVVYRDILNIRVNAYLQIDGTFISVDGLGGSLDLLQVLHVAGSLRPAGVQEKE